VVPVVVVMLQMLMAAGVEDNAPTAVAARAILHERLVRSHAAKHTHTRVVKRTAPNTPWSREDSYRFTT
jgi:hypothetical protein